MRIVIPGKPIGKQSVRVMATHSFMPDKTANWMAYAVGIICTEWNVPMMEGPVQLILTAVMPRPQNRAGKNYADGRMWCPQHPDCDNISKAVCDALTKAGAWRDDKQVVDERIIKVYTGKVNDPPCLIIDVEEINEEYEDIICPFTPSRDRMK